MLRFRRVVLATATVVAGAALSASPAGAYARPPALTYPEQIQTQHFLVHYTGAGLDHVLHQQAADLGALAENAYSAETGWGFPAPPNDGDGLIDIYVIAQPQGVLGSAWPDDETSLTTTTGWIEVDPASVSSQHVIAHELFHLIQFGLWFPTDGWALESTAEWVGFRVDGYSAPDGLELAPPDMSVDCIQWNGACANDDPYELGGYSRWTFWEYLYEKFGNTIFKDVLSQLAAVGDPNGTAMSALATVLAAKGTSLANVFQDYSVANLTGSWPVTALQNVAPPTWSSIDTGTTTRVLPVQRVAVNHLAARYLAFQRGDGSGSDNRCYAASLTLTVALPAGSSAKPYFYWSGPGGAAQPLALNGSTATITLPWDTCNWSPVPPYTSVGYLSLPNPSQTANGQVFTVSGSLTVDSSVLATPDTPPTVPNVRGVVVDAPANEVAPSIFVYGPAVVPLARKASDVRLVVFASGEGKLHAIVGAVDLGTVGLRAGNNDLRLRLPAAARRALAGRGSAVLRLTSLSATGAQGATVTRKLKLAPRHR
jgi:hypothetical protein